MPLKVTFDIAQNSVRWTDADVRIIKRAIRKTLEVFFRHPGEGRDPVQKSLIKNLKKNKTNVWIPAFAGMTVSVTLTTNKQIQKINAEWRKKNQPTNVLSFPTDELENAADYSGKMTLPLGDVMLAYETCAREAKDYGIKFNHHIMFLAVHGTLHLLGYDHETDAQHRQMMRAEIKILTQLGLANPYPFMQ